MEDQSLELYSTPSLNISNCVTVKLTERNYILWKSQFEAFLSGQNLLGYVTGTTPSPSVVIPVPHIAGSIGHVTNPDYQAWTRSDQVVKAWLLGSLSEDIMGIVACSGTSQEVWMSLGKGFS